ncbi:sensor histidine kinase [Jeotgalibacillus salarius]|uniref:histidine kinase n=1 Tax=Jeotgalibacillus salarius TaxID=546023 RepID=A0A4Y8LEE0_9BACL|nr:HAMP domain-containing sensor histidine kinase [Jeotgalibacillus salarius]TFE00686.1 HAMP domain-containing histidine kinase [Jeotgalibacillus salarius]
MLYLLILITVLLIYVLIRFHLLKKEMKETTNQLRLLNQKESSKKVDIHFYDRDFEALAVEINHQIDHTKKAIAEKRASENELKQAISHISHDIRTPMTSIMGYIQFLESDAISEEMKAEYIDTIKTSAVRLKELLEDFFELSIVEQEDYPLKPERIKLNETVIEVLLGFYEEFKNRNIEPVVQIPDHDVVVLLDSSAVKRVIENLLLNAIKHSSGEVTVSIRVEESVTQFEVTNAIHTLNGFDVDHMFDRFYKADQTRMGTGTGLGLPIAKSLMKKMNGTISAELNDGVLKMVCEWKA